MAFTPDWLCCQLYATSRVEKKHRVSVRRPIHRITDDDLDWAIYYGNGRSYITGISITCCSIGPTCEAIRWPL
jgi:hypothetical protein